MLQTLIVSPTSPLSSSPPFPIPWCDHRRMEPDSSLYYYTADEVNKILKHKRVVSLSLPSPHPSPSSVHSRRQQPAPAPEG